MKCGSAVRKAWEATEGTPVVAFDTPTSARRPAKRARVVDALADGGMLGVPELDSKIHGMVGTVKRSLGAEGGDTCSIVKRVCGILDDCIGQVNMICDANNAADDMDTSGARIETQ